MTCDLWILDLNELSARPRAELPGLLVPDERVRAGQFRFAADRDQYALGRGLLRLILSRYLGINPGRLEILTTDTGKPILRSKPLHFSVSHTASVFAVGVHRSVALGLDIERLPDFPLTGDLIDRVCSRTERETLAGLSESDRPARFIRFWTQKEAYLKALGSGLMLAPDRIEGLAHAPDGRPPGVCLDGVPQPGWSLVELEFHDFPDIIGAMVAASDEPLRINRPSARDLLTCPSA